MTKRLAIFTLAALTVFACQKESKPDEPVAPIKVPVQVADVAIASVMMMEDCPDPDPPQEAKPRQPEAEAEDRAESMVEGDSDRGYDPCSQSLIQISFTGQGDSSSKVALKELRLLGPKGATLGSLKTRMPTHWNDNGYSPWDEVVMPGTDVKAAYKLSPPEWSAVESKLGGGSYGTAFQVEIDVEIGGVTKTVRSTEFVRELPEMVET